MTRFLQRINNTQYYNGIYFFEFVITFLARFINKIIGTLLTIATLCWLVRYATSAPLCNRESYAAAPGVAHQYWYPGDSNYLASDGYDYYGDGFGSQFYDNEFYQQKPETNTPKTTSGPISSTLMIHGALVDCTKQPISCYEYLDRTQSLPNTETVDSNWESPTDDWSKKFSPKFKIKWVSIF